MSADKQNVQVYEGDFASLIVTIKDEVGVALPLTGYAAAWIMAAAPGGRAILTKTIGNGGITIQDAVGGVLSILLTSADTANVGQFWHQLVLTDQSGIVSTVTTGTLALKART
jgi:hypothetical protein